jgi:hypothetical protein
MKKVILIISALVFVLSSCTKDFEDMNTNKKDPLEVSGESLFTGAQKNLVDLLLECNVNRNNSRLWMQYWTETTYPDESQYDILSRNVPEYHWRVLYRDVLKDLDEAYKIIDGTELFPTDDPVQKTNKLAIINVLQVYAYSYLVETFGDVPYSQALDIENLLPVYDDGETIYVDLISKLNSAITTLEAGVSSASFGNGDNIYQGSVSQWVKLANSLKLRMGLVLADKASTSALAKTTVEAAASKVFTSNSDNANFVYLSYAPNYNPTYASLVASGRSDHTVANTFVDAMQPRTYDYVPFDLDGDGTISAADGEDSVYSITAVAYTDPRCQYMFDSNYDNDITGIFPFIVYEGGIQGEDNSFGSFTHVGKKMRIANGLGTIFDYAEVCFMLAEGAERGYAVGGTAESFYNAGITASCEFWGVTDATAIANYLALPEVAYTTATGDWKQKIGTQMWMSQFNNGAAAWLHWRRLDWPALDVSEDAFEATVPVRYFYPIVEQTLNGENWSAAVTKLGGDDNLTTQLFWDMFVQN